MAARARCAAVLATLLLACGSDGESTLESLGFPADHCQPLSQAHCLLPWPSAAFLTEADTATGYAIELPAAALPVNSKGVAVRPEIFARYDGFSPNAGIVVGFPSGISDEGLPGPADISASLDPDASVVILDMGSGERVPLFAEIDQNVNETLERTLIIRPMVRLTPAHRYAVAIRDTVRARDGSPLPRSPVFDALLRGHDPIHPTARRRADDYEAVFTALAEAGIARNELVLAWDFVTASDAMLTADLLSMRDRAVRWLDDNDQSLDVSEDPEGAEDTRVLRAVHGSYDAPLFLSNDEEEDSTLVRDDDGLPELQGSYRARFWAVIPACAADRRPVPVVLFGHGLFGSTEDSLSGGLLRDVANEWCVVMIGTDFIGLSTAHIDTVATASADLNKFSWVTDKLAQSIINFIALDQLARGALADHESFREAGEPIVDPSRVHYYGASLGGIMGAVFMSYAPETMRGALGVPGGNWSLMFERSFAWTVMRLFLRVYDQPFEYPLNVAFIAMLIDPYDPITTAARVVANPLPDTPAKHLLLYEAVGDMLVTNHATEMLARTMGIPVTAPSLYVPFGLEQTTTAADAALTIYDEHPEPLPPAGNKPPSKDNGTHGGVHERAAARREIEGLLRDGVVTHPCAVGGSPAPCDCATGACD